MVRYNTVTDHDDSAAINLGGATGWVHIPLRALSPASGGGFYHVPDAWWGRLAQANQHIPADGSRTFVQIGTIVERWNGTQYLNS